MSAAARALTRPAVLPQDEQETAREASRALARLGRGAVHVEAAPISDREPTQTFVLPAPAVKMLCEMLVHLGAGEPVSVIPDNAEFTTGEAADFLNVSRPWIVQLIERNELRHHMVGTHRRILFSDLRAYKERLSATRRAALDRLVADAQAMGEYE